MYTECSIANHIISAIVLLFLFLKQPCQIKLILVTVLWQKPVC